MGPNNTTYKPQAPNLRKSICHIIYLLCTRAFRSCRHLQSFILTVQSEIGLQCTKFRSKTRCINDSKSCVFLYTRKAAVILFQHRFSIGWFSAHAAHSELKNEKGTPKLTKIALNFVKIRYNRPEL